MTVYHSGWQRQATYLTERTPLSAQQAKILALRKREHTTEEIAEILSLSSDTIEDHWDDVLEQWDKAQEFCTIMGPHPWGDSETRQPDVIDDTSWDLRSSAVTNYSDEERTRIELELYHGYFGTVSNTYLLVEREIVDTADYATKTTEHRGAYGPNALRGTIYNDAKTANEYYLRRALLAKAGIDPGADYAPSVESVLGRSIMQTEADAAKDRGLDRVNVHTIE